MTGDHYPCLSLDRDGIARAIAGLHAAGDTRLAPIYRAVRDRGVTLAQYLHPQPIPDLPAHVRAKPMVAIIFDDLGTSYGPSVYDSRALRWLCEHAGAFLIASALPPEEWYQRAVDAALAKGAAVIVDTMAPHELVWLAHATHFSPPDCKFMIAGAIGGPAITAAHRLGGDYAGLEISAGAMSAGAVQ